MELNWSGWKKIPAPEVCRQIEGPTGCGVYQIKNRKTGEFILFGESKTCLKRMKSFFPKPYGTGTRNNESKREYILANWPDLEYRTLETETKEDAVKIDRYLKSLKLHKFNT
ncbi:MAG: hypothetical protein BGN92_05415 [Sphingobacteriales bacterium 41-5]|nr:MAG: hypothetical protein BGN92_05415 [Sphingobacteriales bacterium 41-5]